MSDQNEPVTEKLLTARQKGELEVKKRWGNREHDENEAGGTGGTLTARQRGEAEALKRFGK